MDRIMIVFERTVAEEVSTTEELMIAQNQLKVIDQGYQDLKLDTPDWVMDKLTEFGHEINSRVRSELQRRLRTAKARRSALRTADEKRKDLEAEIAELEQKLT